MNRKLIVNEQLGWPEISESDSKQIVEFLETYFKKHQGLRRKKTLPKKLRLKNKQDKAPETETSDYGKYLKNKLKIGINSITKTLENNPNSLALVLVCRSCKPLTVLTRHIQVMCSMSNTPAGCVYNLNSLAKIFNIKTISALGICKNLDLGQESNTLLYEEFLNQINKNVVGLLQPIKNPFTSNDYLNPKYFIDDVNKEMKRVDLNNESSSETRAKSMAQEQNFGSDFISIDQNSKKIFTNFDDGNFILFDLDCESMDLEEVK